MTMKKAHLLKFLLPLIALQNVYSSPSWLCERVKTMELGSGPGVRSAVALTLVGPRFPSANDTATSLSPCKLRITAPNATYMLLRVIDVKEALLATELSPMLSALGGATGAAVAVAAGAARKWGSRAAPAQDTASKPQATPGNRSEPCTLSVYTNEVPQPIWKQALCGGQAGAVAARAGSTLVPPAVRVVWTPPASPYHHTEKLRLVVTAVNSGAVCSNSSQFVCGALSLCVSALLVCDGVRNCPGGEDEAGAACRGRREPPLLELVRILTARNPELLGVEATDAVTKPSVIMKISEGEQKNSSLSPLTDALKPYGAWGYIMLGVLLCSTAIMVVVVWECIATRRKPEEERVDIPAACVDLAPTLAAAPRPATPPAYEAPPSYSSLFPRAFKSSPTPVPHCSHTAPD